MCIHLQVERLTYIFHKAPLSTSLSLVAVGVVDPMWVLVAARVRSSFTLDT
jgi:hypothetical protein